MPEGRPSALSGAAQKPFAEQIAFFRRKLGKLVPTARWDDLWQEEHDHAFMVAGAAKADLLSDLAAAVDRAIAEGKSLEAFRKDFRMIVGRHGWTGWTGEDSAGGRAWRTRTIYRTNAATSYAAGRNAQLVAGGFALWVYRHGGSQEPREIHLSWNGLFLPPDHPFWTLYYPPSGWGCSCYVVGARSERGAIRLGGDPSKTLPVDWRAVDPQTGLPAGIDKGWGYAPGASVAPIVGAMAEKVRQWDHRIAKAFMEDIPADVRDELVRSYRALPSLAEDLRRYAEAALAREPKIAASRTLGLVSREQAALVREAKPDTDVELFDFAIDPSAIQHVFKQHGSDKTERPRGQRAVTAADYAMLGQLLNMPGAVEDAERSRRSGRELVSLVRRIGNETWVMVFEIRPKQRALALETLSIRVKGQP